MPDAPRPRHHGFTLVEVLCAGMILSIFATVLSMSVAQSTAALSNMNDYQQAAQWLDIILTRIDTYGPDRMLREDRTTGKLDENERFEWQAKIESESEFAGDLYRVEAKVRWKTPQGVRQVKAATLINDPPFSRSTSLIWEDL